MKKVIRTKVKKKKCVMFCKIVKYSAQREKSTFSNISNYLLPTAQIVSTGRDSFVREFNSISRNFKFIF